jgi:toxin HigB-1
LYERGDRSLIRPDLVDRVEVMLAQLDVATSLEAMRIPNYRLHPLKGQLKGYSAVSVNTNCALSFFRFEAGNVYDVEMIDYH